MRFELIGSSNLNNKIKGNASRQLALGNSPLLNWMVSEHPWRPRGGSVGPGEKARQKFSSTEAEKPLGTNSHQTISKRSSECWLLIGHKKCFVLLCPIGEQHLLSSFREFVHDGCLHTGKPQLPGAFTKLS